MTSFFLDRSGICRFALFLRVPVGIALGIAGVLGYWSLSGLDTTLALMGSIPFEIGYNYGLSIYALLTEESIGQLFLAGVVPGIILTGLFMATIALLTWWRPDMGPKAERLSWVDRSTSLVGIVFVVLGGIYLGVFTPVEAAAIGAFLTLVLTVVRRKLSWAVLKFCVLETIRTFAFVYLIVIGAFLFNPFLAVTRIPSELASFMATLELAPIWILLIIVAGYIVLGTFLEGIAMMVLTIPIVYPIIIDMGYDPIWFGALLVVVLEMSLISPPLGLNVFVVKGIADGVPMNEIFIGIISFWGAMVVCAALLIAFPDLALFLPQTMIR